MVLHTGYSGSTMITENRTTSSFISSLSERLRSVFQDRPGAPHAAEHGLDREFTNKVLEASPLSVFIPERFGGRGQRVDECLSMLEACSYESLPLSLVMGINGALFLQPLSKYGSEAVQAEVFDRFLNDKALGGLMITEPGFGSDALQMQTSAEKTDGGYRIRGVKHWGGLTGHADYWLLTARGMTPKGDLERNISFFAWDRSYGGIEVEEYYDNLGLHMIPYGLNRIDAIVPEARKLEPKTTGVRMLLDLLHRSRLQFPGMAMGYLRRLLDEAVAHCKNRVVGGKPLFSYDQVQQRLARMQAAFTACSGMCAFSSTAASVDNDCSGSALTANSIKTVVTDMMQSAAQSLLQLVGAKGYRNDHIAGSAVIDSRPFQIFEGSNDILYQQISEFILKGMGRVRETNLYRYLADFQQTSRVADYLKGSLSFSLGSDLPQRKTVELGKALGRIVSMDMVMRLGDQGFRKELIDNCLAIMKNDVETILHRVSSMSDTAVVEDYQEGSAWQDALLR